jgi:hypothetical protein
MKKTIYKAIYVGLTICIVACKSYTNRNTSNTNEVSKHYSTYDTSDLNGTSLPVLMPYNRIIDPVGTVVSYGHPDLENHSLDIQPIPNTNFLAIEDRYGIIKTILNTKTL